ncbi:uncharacterized protein LOC124897952 [Capsicum annuum]|uniref:uncharacterized protein LOC124897952 n=1 Tax=Capsicum annuum TaxID=4072 RepID=UPI001FB16F08|nr:uncharacterized protein LOC124897952 [Capsicum annuum]
MVKPYSEPELVKSKDTDAKKEKDDKQCKEDKVKVNAEKAKKSVPKYAKYVNDIIVNKNRLTEYAAVVLTGECTSKIQNNFPIMLKDLEIFTLQITISQSISTRGLCDLGASINLMPTSWYRKMGLGSPKPMTIILQLADKSFSRPDGIIEDVLVQVGSLIFPVDFVVLDFDVDPPVPFLAIYAEFSTIIVVNLESARQFLISNDPLERVLIGCDLYGDIEALEMVQIVDLALIDNRVTELKSLNRPIGPSPKASIDEAPKLELKDFYPNLKYVFLGERSSSSFEKKNEGNRMADVEHHRKQSSLPYAQNTYGRGIQSECTISVQTEFSDEKSGQKGSNKVA